MTASIIMMTCGHLDCNAAIKKNKTTTSATKSTALASCWKQSVEAIPGVQVSVTQQGGAEFKWTNWNKFMTFLQKSICVDYPYDAPMHQEQVMGLQGKVKGLAVMGNSISPFVYFLLEDNSVQLYSVYKMCTSWNFYAGSIIGHDIVKIQEKDNYGTVVLVDKKGKKTRQDNWTIIGYDLWGYHIDAYTRLAEHLLIDIDGSMVYTYSTSMTDGVYQVYHGTVTSFKHNEKANLSTFKYTLNTTEKPQSSSKAEVVNIDGSFTVKPERKLDGYFRIVPTKGLNMSGFESVELGKPRNMLLSNLVESSFNNK